MKAVQFRAFGGPDVLEVVHLPSPRAGLGELVLDVHMAGVDPADIAHRKGALGGALPIVPGLTVAGSVAEVGPGIAHFSVGDPVAACTGWTRAGGAVSAGGAGGYAEQVRIDARLAVSLREGARTLSFEEGAVFPRAAVTAYHALADIARLRAGETILIQDAASEAGALAVQFARVLGAGTVIGVVASEAQREPARRSGCDAALVPGGFAARVQALTGNRGVDVVLETSVGDRVSESRKALAPLGRLAFAGPTSSSNGPVPTPLVGLLFHPATANGHTVDELATEVREAWQRAARSAMAYVASGAVRLGPVRVFPLARAPDAHRAVEADPVGRRVVLRVT